MIKQQGIGLYFNTGFLKDYLLPVTVLLRFIPRNLAISIGLAATAFGVATAFKVSLAFLFQDQSAAWFIRLNEKYNILPEDTAGLMVKTNAKD